MRDNDLLEAASETGDVANVLTASSAFRTHPARLGAARTTCVITFSSQGAADHVIRIGTALVELAPDHIIWTAACNGQSRTAAALQRGPGRRVCSTAHG